MTGWSSLFIDHAAMIFIAFSLLFLHPGCGPSISGNASETTNRIAVTVDSGRVNGQAPAFSSVYLYAGSFNPVVPVAGLSDSFMTGSDGRFSFGNIDSGSYNLLCKSIDGLGSTMELNISSISDLSQHYDTLTRPGSIEGIYANYNHADTILTYMFAAGTPCKAVVDSSGKFTIKDLPAARYTIGCIILDSRSFQPLSISEIDNFTGVSVISDSVVHVRWSN
jgi:hypothetical protein